MWLENAFHDLRFASRMARRNPGFIVLLALSGFRFALVLTRFLSHMLFQAGSVPALRAAAVDPAQALPSE